MADLRRGARRPGTGVLRELNERAVFDALANKPQSRSQLWTHVRGLNETEGVTVFLTTHYMDEAQTLADRVAILSAGRIVATGSPERDQSLYEPT